MIKLHTASVKEFQKHASPIQSTTLLPICANIKITLKDGLCLAAKEAIGAGVVGQLLHTEESAPDSVLVNERIFFALASATKSETIALTVVDNTLVIETTNPADKIVLPYENPADFPARPEPPEQTIFKFTKEHIKAINIARNYVSDLETSGAFQFVHTDGENIFGINHNYFYINATFKDLPLASLSKEETAVICAQEEIEIMDSPSHHTFFIPGYTYTFTKTEVKIPSIPAYVERLRKPGKDFTVNRDEFVDFLNLANTISETPVTTCTLSAAGLFAKLAMNDASYGRGNERIINCTGAPDDFTFNSRLIVGPMKSIPYETLGAKTNGGYMIVVAGDEFFVFAGMAKN